MIKVVPTCSPFLRQQLHLALGRLKPGSTRTTLCANLLARMAKGYRLVYSKSMTPGRGQGRGYQKMPASWRFIHEVTNQPNPRHTLKELPSALHRAVENKWVRQCPDGGWEITNFGRDVADMMIQAGLCSKVILDDEPGTRVENGIRFPEPFLQPECPQHHNPTKGIWANGWIAAWLGRPRQYPGKRTSKAWLAAYDLAHAKKYGRSPPLTLSSSP